MLAERNLRDYIGKRLKELGWKVTEWGRGVKGERESLDEVILKGRLFRALERINNVSLNENEKEEVLSRLLLLPNTIGGIKSFLDFAKNGLPLKLRRNGEEQERLLYLFDFENVENNDFFAVKEFEVEERKE